MSDLIGRTLGKYQVVVRVGRGGMARVYKAYQPSLDRYVAIKVLHSHLAEEPDFIHRFEREATAVARLRHPNILQVFDYDVETDTYFIVMEFVDGPTLTAEVIERTKLLEESNGQLFQLEEIAAIFSYLGGAIDYAHARGMIHRDLKPGNIMFTHDGQVLLTDFGLARMIYSVRQTKTGALSGTPAYMSPEQVEGKRIDERSDVYSLGVILYEMVTGRIPFEADTPYAIMSKHVSEEVPLPSKFNRGISSGLEAIIIKVLSKNPDSRFQSAGELAEAIQKDSGFGHVLLVDDLSFAPMATLADNQEMIPLSTHVEGQLQTDFPSVKPYRGLYAFRESDAAYFFGRESVSQRIREMLDDHELVAVIGPSGCGKSSVVSAGLIPELRLDSFWRIIEVRPGSRPFHLLADALIQALDPKLSETDHLLETRSLAEALVGGQIDLIDVLTRIASKMEQKPRILLFVDQFEELYTQNTSEEAKRQYPGELIKVLKASAELTEFRLNVILTLRADFMGQALANRQLADALQSTDVKLGPMERAELGRAIESPAGKLGVVFEAGLVERILDDVGEEPGNLPLLEFALTLLWDQRQGRRMTHASYDAIGRVEGSLARYADEIYEDLDVMTQLRAKKVFTQLVRPGEGTEDTRRLASRDELGSEDWEIIQRLADERLIVTSRTLEGMETAEIVHEALIRGWGRLQDWMNADRSFRVWQERMRVAFRQWVDSGSDEGALLRGSLLAEAEEWLDQRGRELSDHEIEFIETSIGLRERRASEEEAQRARELAAAQKLAEEQERRAEAEFQRAEEQVRAARNLRLTTIVLAMVILIAVAAAIWAVGESLEAAEQADARATEVAERRSAEESAMNSAVVAATRAAESVEARVAAEAERVRANTAADDAIYALSEAEYQRDRADEQASLALARQLAAQSSNLQGPQLDLALLLSLEANKITDSAETRSSILSALQASPALLTYLRGHDGLVQSAAFSPDGQVLATSGSGGRVLLWEVATGDQIGSLDGHDPTQLVNRVVFSPDGNLLATASDDQAIIIWDAETRRPLKTLFGHSSWVQTVTFSPDGEVLASGGGDRIIKLWDVESGELIQSLRGHSGPVWDIDFNPQGNRLVSASADGRAFIWQLDSGEIVHTLSGHGGPILATAYNDQGRLLATGGADNNLRLWDALTGQQVGTSFTGHGAQVIDLAFSPDGTRLASSGIDSTIRLWDVATQQQVYLFGDHNASTSTVTFSPDGRLLASADGAGLTILWDVSTSGQSLGSIISTGQGIVNSVDFLPGKHILAAAGGDGTVRFINTVNGRQESQPLVHGQREDEGVISLLFANDHPWLASGNSNGTLAVWRIPEGILVVPTISAIPGGVSSLAFAPGDNFIVAGGSSGFVTIWDLRDGQQIGGFLPGHSSTVSAVAVSDDGQYYASGDQEGIVVVRSLEEISAGQNTGITFTPDSIAPGPVVSLDFNPTNQLVAAGFEDGIVMLWDLATSGPLLQKQVADTDEISELAFSEDGQLMAVGSTNGTIRLLELLDLSPVVSDTLTTDGQPVSLFFDDNRLLTVNSDGSAFSWAVGTWLPIEGSSPIREDDKGLLAVDQGGQIAAKVVDSNKIEVFDIGLNNEITVELHHWAPYMGNVSTVAYSPDAAILATAGADGAIMLWDASSRKPISSPLLGHSSVVVNMDFSPDGSLIASGSCSLFNTIGNCVTGEVIIWDVVKQVPVTTYRESRGVTQAIDFSPDGEILAINDCVLVEATDTCLEGAILLWEISSGAPVERLVGHAGFVWNIVFSPDGRLIASGGTDNSIVLWDMQTRQPVGQRMTNHNAPIRRLDFSPDGTLLVSGGFDNLVFLWDVWSGQALGGPLAAHSATVQDVEFDPDGMVVASSSLDGRVILWDVDIDSWRSRACHIANRNLRREEWQRFLGDDLFRDTCTDIR